MNSRPVLAAAAALALAAGGAWARGGGGCLEEGTGILTPSGVVAIETLRPGDTVLAVTGPDARPATVRAVVKVQPADYIELTWPGGRLRVTDEHPLAVGAGEFQTAATLGVGRALVLRADPKASPARVTALRRVRADRPAYNLLVAPGGTYVANGLVVHNKGCFLPDTPVLRADGTRVAIRDIRPGESLLAFRPDGTVVSARVRNVLTALVDEYLVVTTDSAVLRVTPDHPFYVGAGVFRTMEQLHPGDAVYAHDGRGGLAKQKIVDVRRIDAPATVYNLQTDEPNTFFADGLAVHNKGGGCFPAGTPILTPEGPRAIETLAPGSVVLAVALDGRAVRTVVVDLLATRRPVGVLRTDAGSLAVTADHPLMTAAGAFREARGASGAVMAWREGRVERTAVRAWSGAGVETTVFNLRVGAPHTFIAGGLVVHNKGGGCFLGETPVWRADGGSVAIREVRAGDVLRAFGPDGAAVTARVRSVVTARVDEYVVLTTERGEVRVTPDHPFYVGAGEFRAIGSMRAGETIYAGGPGGLEAVRIVEVRPVREAATVYNLQADEPHTFFAGSLAVHNKGGGGGFRSSGGSRRSGSGSVSSSDWDSCCAVCVVLVVIVVFVFKIIGWCRGKPKSEENLDYVYKPAAVARKAAKTKKLLEFIARVDEAFAPEALARQAEGTFRKLQECWEARDYGPMRPLMMPDLYAQHCRQIAGMVQQHEIDHIEGLQVKRVEIVNVRYTEKADQREFTALITASARDYYTDDRTGAYLRGDKSAATFQEFWTFQRQEKAWLLREIEQTRESDVLKQENFFEQFTDHGVEQVYAEEAGKEGELGPWLEKGTATKAVKIERLLNFLAATDKLWNRGQMLERARQVFTKVYLSQEAGDPEGVPADDLFPEPAADLKGVLTRRRADGVSVEFRNLCVRKAELILVRNFADNRKDEFTVRISAHAQKAVRTKRGVKEQDADVAPFEEYWTFGRLEKQWKLKEVLPPATGQKALQAENLDEDSTPEQLQWYYRQSRAV